MSGLADPLTADRGGEEPARQQLGLAHGAGPRAAQLAAGRAALLDDVQAGDELGLRPLGAGRILGGQRGEAAHHVHVALVGAEARLHAPDGGEDVDRHAVGLADGGQLRHAVALLLAEPDHARRQLPADVGADRQRELRLRGVVRQHARIGGEAAQNRRQLGWRPTRGGLALVEAVEPGEERRIARRAQELRWRRLRRRRARQGDARQRELEGMAAIHRQRLAGVGGAAQSRRRDGRGSKPQPRRLTSREPLSISARSLGSPF